MTYAAGNVNTARHLTSEVYGTARVNIHRVGEFRRMFNLVDKMSKAQVIINMIRQGIRSKKSFPATVFHPHS